MNIGDPQLPALFGFRIDSDLPLTRCRPAPAPRGVLRVRCSDHELLTRDGELVSWDDQTGTQFAVATSGSVVLLWCSETGSYAIDGPAGQVDVQPIGPREHWEHRLTATVLPLLLAERGDVALHAAAIGTDDGAIVFCGVTGTGKSTLAAALALGGYTVLSEDGVVISCERGEAVVWPGPDGVRITAESMSDLSRVADACAVKGGATCEITARASDRWIKTTHLLSARPVAPLPARAIVLLDQRGGEAPESEVLDPVEALPGLVAYSLFRGRDGLQDAMGRCARLASSLPILRARLPDDLHSASDNARAMLDLVLAAVQLP